MSRARKLWVGVAAASAVATIIAFVIDTKAAFFAYLTAYLYWLSLALGALLLVLIAHLMSARWLVALRRLAELSSATLPVFAVLFLPIALGLDQLYPAARAEGDVPAHLAGYLSPGFFLLRAAVYFATWITLAVLLHRWSLAADRAPRPDLLPRQRLVGAVGLPLYGLTITFAAFDWMMALEPRWFSTIFGVYLFAGSFLGALCVLAVLTYLMERGGPLSGLVNPSHYYAIGRLVFAFVIFWAYIAFSQLFVVFMGDLPEEVEWYAARLADGWLHVAVFLLVAHFVVPFLALLPRDSKRHPRVLAWISAWILVVRYADVYWLVMPALLPAGVAFHWVDLTTFVLVGSATAGFGAWRAGRHSLVALGDPGLPASIRYASS